MRSPVRHHLWRRPWTISPIVGYFLLGTTSSSPLTMFGKKIEYEVESSRKKKKTPHCDTYTLSYLCDDETHNQLNYRCLCLK